MTIGGAVEKLEADRVYRISSHIFSSTKQESIKQCVEPESTKALKIMVFGKSEVVTDKNRALGATGAEVLRRTSSIARSLLSEPEVRAGCKRLLPIFSRPRRVCHRMA